MTGAREEDVLGGQMLQMASRLIRLGGWAVDLIDWTVHWTTGARAIHEVPDDYAPSLDEALAFYPGSTPFDLDVPLVTAAGRQIRVRVMGDAVRDSAGRIVRVQGAVQDVSGVVQMREREKELAERLASTLENITDAFFTLDRQWRFTYLNREAERVLQRRRDGLLGRSVWEEFPAAVGSPFEDHYRRAMTERQTAQFEALYGPLEAWFSVRAYPSSDGIAVYFLDITETRRTRERMAEQAALLDAAREAILVHDLDGRITYWSRGAQRTYGWSADEVLGLYARDFLYVTEPALEIEGALEAAGEWHGDMTHATRDGGRRIVDTSCTVVRDEQGRPKAVLVIGTDVTARKKFEQQMMRAQRLESIGTLAGGIAHDLNNVLTPIMMALELLRDRMGEGPRDPLFDTLQASVQRGADMVRQVLAFARGVEGERVEVQVARVLRDVQALLRDTLPKDIAFTCRTADDLWMVLGDPTQLHQVLTNLCVNARDAMPRGGSLSVSLENTVVDDVYAGLNPDATPGPYVVIKVEDTGTGISSDVQERIFEPFYTTKEVGHGTGLGLSTTLAIVRAHGGFINVYSEVGKGTKFRVYLPAAASGEHAEQVVRRQTGLPAGNGELVLLADDEEAVRVVARKTLERFGYRVLLATHGADAVALYAQHRDDIAVVITDMMMPIMDGPATVSALQAMNPAVRIIGSSGLHANANVSRAVKAGVTHFVSKPYTADALLRVLREVLDTPSE